MFTDIFDYERCFLHLFFVESYYLVFNCKQTNEHMFNAQLLYSHFSHHSLLPHFWMKFDQKRKTLTFINYIHARFQSEYVC